MPAIPREAMSPFTLLMTGRRMTDDYELDDCVADYLAMHPEANEADVRASIEFDTARDKAGTLQEAHSAIVSEHVGLNETRL